MKNNQDIALFLLRISLGWIFLYAGLVKLTNPSWSAEGFLHGAKNLPILYNWFASDKILPITNILNEWGLTLLGISLILGIFVRLSSFFGIILMILYYIAQFEFPYSDSHSFVVDNHVIYIFLLLYFMRVRAGRVHGMEKSIAKFPIVRSFSKFYKRYLG